MTFSTATGPAPADWDLGDWVELSSEGCRGGRTLHTAVNHRTHVAIEFGDDEVDHEGRPALWLRDELIDGGFLAGSPADTASTPMSREQRFVQFMRTLDFSLDGADRLVRRLYRAGVRHAFRPTAVVAQVVLGVAGAVAAFAVVSSHNPDLRVEAHAIPAFFALGLIAVAVHELAHAVVVAHYGRSIDRIGFCFHLATPTFYVESVEALLLTRRQRIIQAAAGPWAEWLVTSLVAIGLVTLSDPVGLEPILQRFVALNIINVVSNLLPFAGLDGALLLADGLRVPDLARRARGSVGRLIRKLADRQRPTAEDIGLVGYATANAIAAVGLIVLSTWLWFEMFADLISILYGHGPIGWLGLTLVGVVISRPALAVVLPRTREAFDTACVLVHDLRFRRSIPWRTAATERLRRLDADVAAMNSRQLGLLAGLLEPVRHRLVFDPRDWAMVEVGPGEGLSKPVRAAISRHDLNQLQLACT
jgi:hypothetical protein